MLARRITTTTNSSRVENSTQLQAAQLKAKATVASADVNGAQQRRAFADLTNVQGNAASQAGRVRKISKPAPVAAGTKAAVKPAAKRPAESELEPMDIPEETVVGQHRKIEDAVNNAVFAFAQRATKKRKSEPENDPMQVDDEEVVMADDELDGPEENAFQAKARPADQDAAGVSASSPSAAVEDIDLYDWDDPQAVTEYVDDIYVYMREVEVR